jgi:plasmid stabilization system protein ParE
MYETMVYWETAHRVPNQPHYVRDWTRQWQAAEKIVYSRTLAETRSVRARIEREFDPDAGPPAQGRRPPRYHREWAPSRRARVKGWSC